MDAAAKAVTAAKMMTTKVIMLRPDQPTYQAVDVLLKNRISGAPVVGADGTLIGVFSEKDGLKAMMRALHDKVPSSVVADDMSTELITVEAHAQLLTVVHLFLHNPVRRIPVLRDGRLVGLLSRRDVLASASRVMGTTRSRAPALLYLSALRDADEVPIKGG